jgi:cytochrome c-type biogenesis protein CcmE
MSSKRSRRKLLVILVLFGVSLATVLGLSAFQQNLLYFYSPTQVKDGEAPKARPFRVGGLVVKGSVKRSNEHGNKLDVKFVVTDNHNSMPISYSGILPDLFREGQGIVAMGKMNSSGLFVASEVLAKHDEKYMPPEVAAELKVSAKAKAAAAAKAAAN